MTLNLSWITDELAIGGSFPGELVELLAREYRIAAVVDLRAEARDDEEALAAHGIAFLHLPTPDLQGVSTPMLHTGVAFARAHRVARRRVLVHCEHGIGRSALLGLCVLVDAGHAPLTALTLAKDRRAKVSPNIPQYEAWATWLREAGHPVPAFDEFATIAYRAIGGHG